MNKTFSLSIALIIVALLMTTIVSAVPLTITPTPELGQLKVCVVAGAGVPQGQVFAIKVDGVTYNVPAGPSDINGYCILVGQYPIDAKVIGQEVIPNGYYVSRIEVRPDRNMVSRTTSQGMVTVKIGRGVTEVIFTNKVIGTPTPTRTPTSLNTSTPRPTRTATSTPSCDPNCTPTPTPIPRGRLQICKEAEGAGVAGYFTFEFNNRSRTIPVGACAGLIGVNAGALTITEVPQAGYTIADIYTIPDDRLISKDLNGSSAKVRIVEGGTASQTIVVFRNRAVPGTASSTPTHTSTSTSAPSQPAVGTPSSTATNTPTGGVTPTFTTTPTATTPPSLCPPTVIAADFSAVQPGQSVEGLGVVAPYLNIDAKGTAVRIAPGVAPASYFAPNGSGNIHGGLGGNGGFSDVITRDALQAHQYTFTFASGISITNFSLRMLDYGDWNPTMVTSHYASMTAYDGNGNVVSKEEISYTSPPDYAPRSSSLYGDLYNTGDGFMAPLGQPGNWIWNVSGNGIVRVDLEFGVGFDPWIGFDSLSFTVACR